MQQRALLYDYANRKRLEGFEAIATRVSPLPYVIPADTGPLGLKRRADPRGDRGSVPRHLRLKLVAIAAHGVNEAWVVFAARLDAAAHAADHTVDVGVVNITL